MYIKVKVRTRFVGLKSYCLLKASSVYNHKINICYCNISPSLSVTEVKEFEL